MDSFKKLLQVAETLLGPKGCPWDKEQTLTSLQPYLLEEVHELIEAIDLKDPKKMKEELGDVFYTVIFVAILGKKEGFFTLDESIQSICEKLVRRHPHIFGSEEVADAEDVMRNWEKIKMKEGRNDLFEGIPPTLPALARAQKMASTIRRKRKLNRKVSPISEEELGAKLWALVEVAESYGIDAENALRRYAKLKEKNTGD